MHIVTRTESGTDFISLYFQTAKNAVAAAKYCYSNLKRIGEHEFLTYNRKNFVHLPGDVPRFHPDGAPDARYEDYHHFHILFPHHITEECWQYVYDKFNTRDFLLEKSVPHREVSYGQ